jgi:hypothetical protein
MKPKTFLFPGIVKGLRADVPISPNVIWLACRPAAQALKRLASRSMFLLIHCHTIYPS